MGAAESGINKSTCSKPSGQSVLKIDSGINTHLKTRNKAVSKCISSNSCDQSLLKVGTNLKTGVVDILY